VNRKLVADIADAVLYEGYVLYPYRASSVKNRQRWNFGVLYPRTFAESQLGNDRWNMQTECLARITGESAELHITVRFLQLLERTSHGETSGVWQEGAEREVELAVADVARLIGCPMHHAFAFDGGSEGDGSTVRRRESVEGAIKFARCFTGRQDIVYCDHAFHGLTTGSLSINGADFFRERFGDLMPGTRRVPIYCAGSSAVMRPSPATGGPTRWRRTKWSAASWRAASWS